MYGLPEPRGKPMSDPLTVVQPVLAGAIGTSPIIPCRVDFASRTHGNTGRIQAAGIVVSANIGDSDVASQQIVEMDVNRARSRGANGDVNVFIGDNVLRNDRAQNGRVPSAAVDMPTVPGVAVSKVSARFLAM